MAHVTSCTFLIDIEKSSIIQYLEVSLSGRTYVKGAGSDILGSELPPILRENPAE
ncbi:MAG: hypothetical protein HXS52_01310 [Theionarchaea archaeon]|nr:hypothetical protein [Theionarchaea archaeon]